MKKLLSIFAITLLAGVSAHAGFLIEPYFGYIASGTATGNFTLSGSEIGARLGWDFLGFGAGLDAAVSGTTTFTPSSGSAINYTPADYGVFVCYKFPILFRVYASYFPTTKETDSTGAYENGNATKIGVQYTGLPFIAIGLESFSENQTKYTNAAGTSSTVTGTESQTRVTISLPFSI